MAKNIAASVKARLLNHARSRGDDFNQLLDRYTRERFLYRLAESSIGKDYILKGASVFQVLLGDPHRPTRDIDLLGFGNNDPEILKANFEKVCQIKCEDGLEFSKIFADILQKGQKYEGVRLNIEGQLGTAKLFLQVDVGFGHVVTPAAKVEEIPTLLDLPSPKMRVYPPETIIAEKLEAMVSKGENNSRIKDYYDCLFLAQNFQFKGNILKQAIKATFEHRKTPLPDKEIPFGLRERFVTDRPSRNNQWQKLVEKGNIAQNLSLVEAIAEIREFVLPPLQAAANKSEFNVYWSQLEKWQERNLYEIYSEGVQQFGLAGSQEIAINALKDGVERHQVIEMMQNNNPAYQRLVSRSGAEIAERTVVSQAEVKIMESQMSESEEQSQEQKEWKRRGRSL